MASQFNKYICAYIFFICFNIINFPIFSFKSLYFNDNGTFNKNWLVTRNKELSQLISMDSCCSIDIDSGVVPANLKLYSGKATFLKSDMFLDWITIEGPGSVDLNHYNISFRGSYFPFLAEIQFVGPGSIRLEGDILVNDSKLVFKSAEGDIKFIGKKSLFHISNGASLSIDAKTKLCFDQVYLKLDSKENLKLFKDAYVYFRNSVVQLGLSVRWLGNKSFTTETAFFSIFEEDLFHKDVAIPVETIDFTGPWVLGGSGYVFKSQKKYIFDGHGVEVSFPSDGSRIFVLEDDSSVKFVNCSFTSFQWDAFVLGKGCHITFGDNVIVLADDWNLPDIPIIIDGLLEVEGINKQCIFNNNQSIILNPGGRIIFSNICLEISRPNVFIADDSATLVLKDANIMLNHSNFEWLRGLIRIDGFVKFMKAEDSIGDLAKFIYSSAHSMEILDGAFLKMFPGTTLSVGDANACIKCSGASSVICLSDAVLDVMGQSLSILEGTVLFEGNAEICSSIIPGKCIFGSMCLLKVLMKSSLCFRNVVVYA